MGWTLGLILSCGFHMVLNDNSSSHDSIGFSFSFLPRWKRRSGAHNRYVVRQGSLMREITVVGENGHEAWIGPGTRVKRDCNMFLNIG